VVLVDRAAWQNVLACQPSAKLRQGKVMIKTLLAVCLATILIPVFIQAEAEKSVAPLIDNERVRVWDVVLTKGQRMPIKKYELDAVQLFLTDGDIRVNNAHGSSKEEKRKEGEAVFIKRGTEIEEEMASETPIHSVIVELKDKLGAPMENKTGLPNAFPRPRASLVLENARLAVWGYQWNLGEPTPMHYHDKDAVVIYMENGSLKRSTPGGEASLNDISAGEIHYIPRGAKHTELLVRGKQRALMVKLN